MRFIVLISLAVASLVGFLAIKFATTAAFTSRDYLDIYNKDREIAGELRAWKYRDGLTTCYVFVTRSGPKLWFPTAQCSIWYP